STVWVSLGTLVTGQHLPKNKRPKEPGENRIKPTNKKVKPKIPKIKDRDSANSAPKTQSIMMQVLDKGRFQKPAATLSLLAGQTVELRCKGSRIGWSYPAYLDTFKDSRLSVKQNERYGQLTLVNSTSADTGEFSCWVQLCSGYICRKDEAKRGSTYIFFTGKILGALMELFKLLDWAENWSAVAPSQLTATSGSLVRVCFQGYTRGLTLPVSCLLPVPSGPPSTTILASSNKVKSGDDISVLCTVLGEPDVEVEFTWIFPGQKDERPVTIQDTWRLIHRGLGHTTRISQSVITVEDFETIDAGYYICTAQNLQGQTTVATTVEFS
uniref:Platelet-derived growth factor receptor-like protein n=1 Tax=Pan troglodytes TaxID=9598 RepID=H2QVT0_PANTR